MTGRSASASKPVRPYLAAGLLLSGLLGGCRATQEPAPLSQAPGREQVLAAAAHLDDGDLVFRRGRDLMSALVLRQGSGSRFSHVGMVVREADRVDVVHAMPDEPGRPGGVRRESLQAFLALPLASDAASLRASGLALRQQAALRSYLLSRIGSPFDNAFELSDDSRLYCTEVAVAALAAAGVQLRPATQVAPLLREPVVTPDGLFHTPGLRPLPR